MVGHRDIGEVVSGEPARLDRLIAGAYDHQPRLLARRVAQVLHGHGQVLGHPVAVLSYLSQRLAAEHPSDVGPVRVQVAVTAVLADPRTGDELLACLAEVLLPLLL